MDKKLDVVNWKFTERKEKDKIILEIKTELQVIPRRIDSAENIFGIEEQHEAAKIMKTKCTKV